MVIPNENSSRIRQPQQVPSSSGPAQPPVSQVVPSIPPKPAMAQFPPKPSAPSDSEDNHSIGTLIMIGAGLLFALIIAVTLIVFIFSKFGGKSNKTVTLEYWGLWEDSGVMQSVISDFERQNPMIKVQYVKEDPKEYADRLLTHIQQGDGPDIFRFHNSWTPMFLSVLSPLTQDTMSAKEFATIFYPVAQQDLVKNGAIYG
ncbi:MAG: carbohydrate ABC transporter substrate-binding protein, partial [Patescibacteria group bacterium]|nr:carbohydrate ABC transporter substrate-binding protein [Patescibacteria group bacterium]